MQIKNSILKQKGVRS